MITRVTEATLPQAAAIHSESWIESHRSLCSAAFLAAHTPERQMAYILAEETKGAQFYLLTKEKPVGIVSVQDSLIANLYVLPGEQNKGYGTNLLMFAVKQCVGVPTLWILANNERARRLYERHGFRPTGVVREHAGGVNELEFSLCGVDY